LEHCSLCSFTKSSKEGTREWELKQELKQHRIKIAKDGFKDKEE
jgi:ribosomal protein L37E